MASGTVTKKGFNYRKALLDQVKNDPSHPINNGVHMQAHHLISEEGVKHSEMGALLKARGYDINVVENLVFIPSNLPGACHLRVQPHRGDHTHVDESDDDYDDDEHPRSYHLKVKMLLQKLEIKVMDCESKDKTQILLNKVSKEILSDVKNFRLPLTSIFKAFRLDSKVGCGNCIDVKQHENDASACLSNRDHHGQEHPMFKSGKGLTRITSEKHNFTLRVAR